MTPLGELGFKNQATGKTRKVRQSRRLRQQQQHQQPKQQTVPLVGQHVLNCQTATAWGPMNVAIPSKLKLVSNPPPLPPARRHLEPLFLRFVRICVSVLLAKHQRRSCFISDRAATMGLRRALDYYFKGRSAVRDLPPLDYREGVESTATQSCDGDEVIPAPCVVLFMRPVTTLQLFVLLTFCQ